MLRFLTAGESHGPALVVTVEGLPAGVPILIDDIAASWRAAGSATAAVRACASRRTRSSSSAASATAARSASPLAILIRNSEWATGKWADEMSAAPGRTALAADPAPARSRRSRGHAEVRVRRRARRARTRASRARPRRGSRRARSPRRCSAQLDISVLSHVVQLGAATASLDRRPGPDDLEQVDTLRGPVLRSRLRSRHDPRDQRGGQGRRLARRSGRGARLRHSARARFARALGPAHRRPARAGADEHPGDEGGRDRRRAHGRRRARQRGARRDRLGRRGAASTAASRRARAASRAA